MSKRNVKKIENKDKSFISYEQIWGKKDAKTLEEQVFQDLMQQYEDEVNKKLIEGEK